MTTQSQPPAAGQAAHTPPPWRVKRFRNTLFIEHTSNWDVCSVKIEHAFDERTAKANFAFIVRACNSHAALVEALESCRDYIAAQHASLPVALTDPMARPVLLGIAAALQITKEGQP